MRGIISGIQKFSLNDGPGIRTIVFFKGCPLSCPWCSNPENLSFKTSVMYNAALCVGCGMCMPVCQRECLHTSNDGGKPVIRIDRERCISCGACCNVCTSKALRKRGESMSVEDVMLEVRKDRLFYKSSGGGVTFSGGEALSQSEFLLALAKQCREEGIHTAIETSGYANWESLSMVYPYIDLFLFDLKIMDEGLHKKHIGVFNTPILENLRKLRACNAEVIIRVPIIPGYTDGLDNVEKIAEIMAECEIPTVHLLPYHKYSEKKYHNLGKDYPMGDILALAKDDMNLYIPTFSQHGIQVHIGG
ncbi:MAG: glycyl-radical enzyme activating protein [Desulfosporosinus sp.]|jgi:pyruvate formate lyase activating enzyme|nr:glycyl-radical enzyme activating protein [Desulfosporosinus sp.]